MVSPAGATRLPPLAANADEAFEHVETHGYARMADVLTPAEVEEARTRLFEQAEAERERGCAELEGSVKKWAVGPNQRVRNLINKGEVFRRIATHPVALQCERLLLGKDFLLSSMSANITGTRGLPMGWHTDQIYAHWLPYRIASAIVWMLDDFTEENGATVVYPGSHRWTGPNNSVSSKDAVATTGHAGTILIMDGRTVHNTGMNMTNRPRAGLITYFVMPFIRQEEKFSLSLSPSVMEQCAPELLSLLGFEVWFRLGGVDGADSGTLYARRPTSFSGEWRPRRLTAARGTSNVPA